MTFELPDLSYPYDALEPFFDKKTMEIHHQKHHQAYINNANKALQDLPEFSNLSALELIKNLDKLPKNKRIILRNNVGGHINHNFFWKSLQKNTILQGNLKKLIEQNFSNIPNFRFCFEQAAINHFGSGWIWLMKKNKILSIISTINQDNPWMDPKITDIHGYPILGLDVWEHAYYLKYQNNRLHYIQSFWNVINWNTVSQKSDQNNTSCNL